MGMWLYWELQQKSEVCGWQVHRLFGSRAFCVESTVAAAAFCAVLDAVCEAACCTCNVVHMW
jgi:hypothetical protein